MTIVLAGGSGFLGRRLHDHFTAGGHTVLTLTRRPRPDSPAHLTWQPDGTAGPWAAALADADVIVNLAGEGIADKRWTTARKASLRSSRLQATRSLAQALTGLPPRPRTLINASAIGYYGPRGDETITEDTPPGTDFLATLCVDWEREAAAAASPTTRVALVRTGLVLHPDGGALKTMLTPFRLGIGGPLASGRQYMSWIHLDDWVGLVKWLATAGTETDAGTDTRSSNAGATAWNATAPSPVTNREFSRTLGRVLSRPAAIPVPAFALRLVLGEFAAFVTTGARVVPARAERHGFRFRYRELEAALGSLLGRG